MVHEKAQGNPGVRKNGDAGGVRRVPAFAETAERATSSCLRTYAAAADDGLDGITDPRIRSVASLTAAAFLFAAAIAEAAVFLNANAIDSAVLDGAEFGCKGLAKGAVEILEDENLAKKFMALSGIVSAGMGAIVTECVMVCDPTYESTMVN